VIDLPSSLPRIDAGDLDLPRVAEATWEALQADNAVPYVFRYGGLLSRIEEDEEHAVIVRPVTVDRLRHILARIADWYARGGKGKRQEAPALPPLHVVKDMLARPDPPLPVLARIVHAPVFGPAGRLCLTGGYHHEARIYVALAPGLTIARVPEAPDAEMVQIAVTVLRELLADFPFVSEAERANALALLLTPFVRDLVDGPVPLAIIEKPTPGTGATLLADIAMLPATGRHLAAMTVGRDVDEWRKRLTA
jgi:putative DNA primase/helicase